MHRLCHGGSMVSPASLSHIFLLQPLAGHSAPSTRHKPRQPLWSGDSAYLWLPQAWDCRQGTGKGGDRPLMSTPLLSVLQIFGDYYHFRHSGVVKRSLSPHQPWHSRLAREPQVRAVGAMPAGAGFGSGHLHCHVSQYPAQDGLSCRKPSPGTESLGRARWEPGMCLAGAGISSASSTGLWAAVIIES